MLLLNVDIFTSVNIHRNEYSAVLANSKFQFVHAAIGEIHLQTVTRK